MNARQRRQQRRTLIKAKAKCGHGKWLAWLKKNIHCSERQAQNYMRLAKSAVTSDLEEAWRVILGNDENETHVSHNTGEHEWYTPLEFLDATRDVFGHPDEPTPSKHLNRPVT